MTHADEPDLHMPYDWLGAGHRLRVTRMALGLTEQEAASHQDRHQECQECQRCRRRRCIHHCHHLSDQQPRQSLTHERTSPPAPKSVAPGLK